jgi:hypothetical protein
MILVPVIGILLGLFVAYYLIRLRLSLVALPPENEIINPTPPLPDEALKPSPPPSPPPVRNVKWADREVLVEKFEPYSQLTLLGPIVVDRVIENWFSFSDLYHTFSGVASNGGNRYTILYVVEKKALPDRLAEFIRISKLLNDSVVKVVSDTVEAIDEYYGYIMGIHNENPPPISEWKDLNNVLMKDQFIICESIDECLVDRYMKINSRKEMNEFFNHLIRAVDVIKNLHDAKLSIGRHSTERTFIIRSSDQQIVIGDIFSFEPAPFIGVTFDFQIVVDIVQIIVLDPFSSSSQFVSDTMRTELNGLRDVIHQGYRSPQYDSFKSIFAKCIE